MQFRTQYERVEIHTEAGLPVRQEYEGHYDDRGNIVLKPTRVINIYEKIQADKDATDINLILRRYLNGDTDALNRVQASYVDTTLYPKTLMESLNMTIQAQKDFDRLPADIKQKFDNNFARFISEIGTKDFAEKLGAVKDPASDPVVQPIVKESSSNES